MVSSFSLLLLLQFYKQLQFNGTSFLWYLLYLVPINPISSQDTRSFQNANTMQHCRIGAARRHVLQKTDINWMRKSQLYCSVHLIQVLSEMETGFSEKNLIQRPSSLPWTFSQSHVNFCKIQFYVETHFAESTNNTFVRIAYVHKCILWI